MRVEAGTVADADDVADLWVELAAEQRQYGSRIEPGANRAAAREEAARHAVSETLLVARDDAVVGFVTFSVADSAFQTDLDHGVVENIYVASDYRNRGIGSELLERAEASLRDHGVEAVRLEAMAANEDARRFYRRHGFEPHRVELAKPLESDNHSKGGG